MCLHTLFGSLGTNRYLLSSKTSPYHSFFRHRCRHFQARRLGTFLRTRTDPLYNNMSLFASILYKLSLCSLHQFPQVPYALYFAACGRTRLRVAIVMPPVPTPLQKHPSRHNNLQYHRDIVGQAGPSAPHIPCASLHRRANNPGLPGDVQSHFGLLQKKYGADGSVPLRPSANSVCRNSKLPHIFIADLLKCRRHRIHCLQILHHRHYVNDGFCGKSGKPTCSRYGGLPYSFCPGSPGSAPPRLKFLRPKRIILRYNNVLCHSCSPPLPAKPAAFRPDCVLVAFRFLSLLFFSE